MKTEHPQGLYPIGTVSNITGINPVTLRAWERRYELINPTRTESGHRLYSEHDIEQIKLILALLDEGIAISRVKDAMRVAAENSKTTAGSTHWARYRDRHRAALFFGLPLTTWAEGSARAVPIA